MGLTTALKEGDSSPVMLSFQNDGEITVDVEVLSVRAKGPDCAPVVACGDAAPVFQAAEQISIQLRRRSRRLS
jgi:hypothetical protein